MHSTFNSFDLSKFLITINYIFRNEIKNMLIYVHSINNFEDKKLIISDESYETD